MKMMNIKEERWKEIIYWKENISWGLSFIFPMNLKKNLPHFQKFLPLIFEIFYKIFGGATTHSKYPSSLEKVFWNK